MLRTLESFLDVIHGYASFLVGALLYFHRFAPIDLAQKKNVVVANELALYAISSLAFGALIYVGTRPIVIALQRLMEEISKAVANVNRH
ncbi:MAG: hypothetical protein AB7F43_01955 [Bacteriovoracia bacterium]